MPTLLPERSSAETTTSRQMLIGFAIYGVTIASLICLFSLNPRAATWISEAAQSEFANETLEPPTAIAVAKLGSVAYP